MARSIIERVLTALFVVFGSTFLVFTILYVLPGDPVDTILDPSVATPEMIEKLRQELGVDQPFHIQLFQYYSQLFQGDFGQSLVNSTPVLPSNFGAVP